MKMKSMRVRRDITDGKRKLNGTSACSASGKSSGSGAASRGVFLVVPDLLSQFFWHEVSVVRGAIGGNGVGDSLVDAGP